MWDKIVAFFMSILMFFANLFGIGNIFDDGLKAYEDLKYGSHERNSLDLYLPENTTDTGLVLFIHGGAWVGGDKNAYTSAAKDSCKQFGIATATINYRYLSEAVTMADIIDDVDAAVAKIKETADENGINVEKMLLTGHSAGAHLAMLYAYSKKDTAPITPGAVTDYSGPTDLNDPNFLIDNELGEDNILMLISWGTGINITKENIGEYADEIAKISPISYVDENTVPTIINHGTKDTIVPYSNAVSLHEKMTEYGVTHVFNPFPDSGHGLENNEEKDDYAYTLMIEYLREYVLK